MESSLSVPRILSRSTSLPGQRLRASRTTRQSIMPSNIFLSRVFEGPLQDLPSPPPGVRPCGTLVPASVQSQGYPAEPTPSSMLQSRPDRLAFLIHRTQIAPCTRKRGTQFQHFLILSNRV